MQITIYGSGCAKCAQLEQLVREVVALKAGNITVEKVSDFQKMMIAGVMSTPALAIDGALKVSGRIPSKEEVSAWIDGAAGSVNDGTGCCCCAGK